MNVPETFATGITQEQASNALGTDFAKFQNFGEYAWHLKNIHNVTLRKTQSNAIGKSVTSLTECDCFANGWG